jgi:hypothetical protein
MKPHVTAVLRSFTIWILVPLSAAFCAEAEQRKPNFLFLIADDHRWDAMGAVQREHGDKARYPCS